MKSSNDDLRNRGFITTDDINKFEKCSNEKLKTLIYSENPVERSVAVKLLSKRNPIENLDFMRILLGRLYFEKCLYTRIEMCKALQKGSVKTAEILVCHLGCVGTNQYKSLPKKISQKKSYPLPRDIIARILGKMDPDVLPVLFEVLNHNNEKKISEVIDAIGFLLFYNPDFANEGFLEAIINILNKYIHNELIVFKCVCCLSAFKYQRSIEVLSYIINHCNNEKIKANALRSLNIITPKYEIENVR